MTDEELPECEIDGCERPISDVFEDDEQGFPVTVGDVNGHFKMCDEHNVAARVLGYSREEPPYCDLGLYKEIVFYARQLAALYIDPDIDESEVVITPEEHSTEE